MNTPDLSGRGSMYSRASDDTQDISRQRTDNRNAISRWGGQYPPPERIYEDHGWKRWQADVRPEWQRLLADAEAGLLDWIMIDAQDRAETADKWETAAMIHRLRKAGVRLYIADGREMTSGDILGFLQTGMGSEKSEAEQGEKAKRVLKAKRERIKRGEWQGGHIPYAADVVCLDANEAERWRVIYEGRDLRVKVNRDASRKRYDGKHNFPATENDETLQLRPTLDAAKLDVAREVFARFDRELVAYHTVAKDLNTAKVPPPPYSKWWEHYHVRAMLRNPFYVGLPAWNKGGQGRYMEIATTDAEPTKVTHKQADRRRPVEQWIKPVEPLFAPIVALDVWERVQAKITGDGPRAPKKRAPKSADLWLSQLLYCAGCGQPMRGYNRPGAAEYICRSYASDAEGCQCERNSVKHSTIEADVREWLEKTGHGVAALDQTAKLAGQPPKAWHETIRKLVTAQENMLAQLSAADRERALDNHDWSFTDVADVNGQQIRMATPVALRDVEGIYRQMFASERQQLQHRADELETRHTEEWAAMKLAKTDRTRAKQQAIIDEIEAELAELEKRLRNAADDAAQAVAEIHRMGREWTEAARAINSGASQRQKANAIRKVIGRIYLTFKPTGRQHPTSELVNVEIIPAEYPNGASGSPGTARFARRTCGPVPPPGR